MRFIAWYLVQGADRVCILFDNPDDPAIAMVQDHPQVDCIRCTPEFWRELELTPGDRFTRRQNHAMTWLYRQCREGWFLNVDADEYVWLDGRSLREELETLPDVVRGVRILTAERIQTPGLPGHHFRLQTFGAGRAKVYGPEGNPLIRRSGMIGHHIGKAVTRAGIKGAFLRQHWADGPGGERLQDLSLGRKEGAYLLHFHDAGYETWRAKLDWRLASSGFRDIAVEALTKLRDAPDGEAGMRALYDHACLFDLERLEELEQVGAHLGLDFDFDVLVEAAFAPRSEPARRVA
ncbi:glycosyltransferase family 2 protein [Oceanicola sp. 22II-s10i]|uniref:glycosyltransferase family 2 protein n=1 Tax=Oceanicola sp. 22II-s10i TaxID=1317116 RepID=UPI001C3E54E3|nr:glycosyltransferase family 2 protein [Oceanicola sp. 22II-s10i]